MGERNVACTNQIVDMELDSGQLLLHEEPYVPLGNTVGFFNPNAHPSQISSGIPANFAFHQFFDHNGNNPLHGNPYNLQYNHGVTNFEVGCLPPPNFSSSSYVASSSSRPTNTLVTNGGTEQFSISSSNRVMGAVVDERGLNGGIIDNVWVYNKRKHEGVPEHCYYANGLANTDPSSVNISTSFGYQHQSGSYEASQSDSYEAGPSVSGAVTFMPEHQVCMFPMLDGSQERMRVRTTPVDILLESAFVHHRNHLLQDNYMSHPFQHASSWPDQFASNAHDGGTSSHAYTHPAPYLLGYPGPSTSRSAAVAHHPDPLYSHHHQVLPGQGMQNPAYGHYQIAPPLPFVHPAGNSHIRNTNTPRDGLQLGPRFTRIQHSNASDGTFRPPQRIHAARDNESTHAVRDYESTHAPRDYDNGHLRVIRPEHVAFLDLSVFYETEHQNDEHRDMRMDIEDMSYEELLALEEQIGDVSVGLSEEAILKNLKTKIYVSQLASLSLRSPCTNLESETCVICQVEFEENERIGALDCRHEYHVDCIKEWLLVKNICPICKTTAIEQNRKDRW